MKRASLVLILTLLGACSDGAGPARVGSVDILRNSQPASDLVLQIGETAQLTASIKDEGGTALTGRQVSWRSTASGVASVDATGLVTGVSAGEAQIIATADGVSDTVTVTVQSSNLGSLTCASGDAGLDLAVGQVYAVSAGGSPVLCLNGGGTGSEYVLVPFNSAEGPNTLQVEVAGSGIVPAIGPPTPALYSREGLALEGARGPRPDVGFHHRLREMERQRLTPLIRGGGGMPGPSYSISAAVASVGDTLTLNVNATEACSNPDNHKGVVVAVTQRAVVVADVANPSGGFTADEYRQFGETFDTLVYPTVTSNFGIPTDIDDNGGRSLIFFTRAVNELTASGSSSYVAGFFFARDLFPKTNTQDFQACPTSNFAEMFYMLVPDPNGEVNNNVRTKTFVSERTVGVLAHEFQHLINAARRLRIVKATGSSWNEQTWLNEGMSHIAEELVFYRVTEFEPRQNITLSMLSTSGAFDPFNRYVWSNFARYIEYLKTPRQQSLMGLSASDDDLQTRGATWAFLRYAADRETGPDSTLWRKLVDTDKTGLTNLNTALNVSALDWMRDWTVSVYADDSGVPTAPPYQQPSWDYRGIITGVKGSSGNLLYPTFPLEVVPLKDGESQREQMTLQGGGAAFLRFGIATGGRAALRASSGGATAPSRLWISILRTK